MKSKKREKYEYTGNNDIDFRLAIITRDLPSLYILADKVDINKIDKKHKNTPLHLAASLGRLFSVIFLIGKGANIYLVDSSGLNAYSLANQNGRTITQRVIANFIEKKQKG